MTACKGVLDPNRKRMDACNTRCNLKSCEQRNARTRRKCRDELVRLVMLLRNYTVAMHVMPSPASQGAWFWRRTFRGAQALAMAWSLPALIRRKSSGSNVGVGCEGAQTLAMSYRYSRNSVGTAPTVVAAGQYCAWKQRHAAPAGCAATQRGSHDAPNVLSSACRVQRREPSAQPAAEYRANPLHS